MTTERTMAENTVIPRHIAFIMDGNGRWAQEQGLPRRAGHKVGYERIPDVLETCYEHGVEVVSAYAWSTENWGRPQAEVQFIVRTLERSLLRFVQKLHERNVRFIHSGGRENLSSRAQRALDSAVALTQHNGPHCFNLLFNYGSRAEIVNAARQLLVAQTMPDGLTDDDVEQQLWMSGLPDVDLIIRTGGDKRISNCLMWKAAYASVYVADNYWPAVTPLDIAHGIADYQRIMINRH